MDDLYAVGLPEGSLVGVSVERIEKQLDAASRKVDSYLRGRGYNCPLEAWGMDLTQCTAAIAAWDILRHLRGVSPDDPGHQALVKPLLLTL